MFRYHNCLDHKTTYLTTTHGLLRLARLLQMSIFELKSISAYKLNISLAWDTCFCIWFKICCWVIWGLQLQKYFSLQQNVVDIVSQFREYDFWSTTLRRTNSLVKIIFVFSEFLIWRKLPCWVFSPLLKDSKTLKIQHNSLAFNFSRSVSENCTCQHFCSCITDAREYVVTCSDSQVG